MTTQTKFETITVLCKSNTNEIRRITAFVLAKFRAMSSEITDKVRSQNEFRGNIVRYFERSNEKSLLRKCAKAKIRGNKKELDRYKSVAAIDVTSDHTAERSMSERDR